MRIALFIIGLFLLNVTFIQTGLSQGKISYNDSVFNKNISDTIRISLQDAHKKTDSIDFYFKSVQHTPDSTVRSIQKKANIILREPEYELQQLNNLENQNHKITSNPIIYKRFHWHNFPYLNTKISLFPQFSFPWTVNKIALDNIPLKMKLPSLNENLRIPDFGKYYIINNDYKNFKEIKTSDSQIGKYAENKIPELNELKTEQEKNSLSSLTRQDDLKVQQISALSKKLPEAKSLRREAGQKAIESARKFISEHQDLIMTAQKKLFELKKKYRYVPSLLDMKSAKRINNLSNEPFGKRLMYGADFRFNRGNPFGIDFSALAGYSINKRLRSGFTFTWRLNLSVDTLKIRLSTPRDTYGASVFTDYFLLKGFFAHTELESMHSVIMRNDTDFKHKWINGLLAGIGHEFVLSRKLRGSVMILYNLFQSAQSPYHSPWQVKFGIYKK